MHIHAPGGLTRVFAPGDEVPEDLARLVRNPAVWGDDAAEVTVGSAVDQTDGGQDDDEVPSDHPAGEGPDGDEDAPTSEIPPKSGPEGSRAAWADYAAARGVEIPATMKRNEIIAALEAAGHPTE